MLTHHRSARIALALASIGAPLCTRASAQVFSIDYRGPTIGVPGPTPITHGDLLTPAPPGPAFAPPALPPPMIALPAGVVPFPGLGLATAPGCIGMPPGAPCPVEVDAVSNGADFAPPTGVPLAGRWVFSVDEFAVGFPGSPFAPNVLSETPCFDVAADVFEALNVPPEPIPPIPLPVMLPGNTGLLDGNGVTAPCGGRYVGVGLVEPRPAFAGPGPRPGDNLDALEMDPIGPLGVFFSLDAAFPMPCYGVPGTGSAAANGFFPGAILFSPPGGPPIVWAPPIALGLDLAGPGTDDLDALVIANAAPFAFGPGDYVRFSVRRGSAVVGMLDSNFGFPIEPGDILNPPPALGMPPGIAIPAEYLGLATVRSGTAIGCPFGDDLDALDTRAVPATAFGYCYGDGSSAPCPCGNAGANGRGCANSVFPAGALLTAAGAASVAGDTVVLTCTSASGTGLYFQGTAQADIPFDDGKLCIGGVLLRLGLKSVDLTGTSMNPSGVDLPISVKGAIPPAGGTRTYQVVYRNADPLFCPPATTNRSNGIVIVWMP